MNDLLYTIGLKVDAFAAGARRVVQETKGIQRTLGDLRKLFLAGGLITLVKGFFDNAVRYARDYQGATDSNIQATLRFGEHLEKLSNFGAKVGSAVLGAFEKVGVALGAMVYGVDAATDAWDKMNKSASQALDPRRAQELAAALDLLAKTRRDIAFAESNDMQRMVMLINEQVDLREQINALGSDDVERTKKMVELERSEAALRKLSLGIDEEHREAVQAKAEAEQRQHAELVENEAARKATLAALRSEQDKLIAAGYRELEIKKKIAEFEFRRLSGEGVQAALNGTNRMLNINGRLYRTQARSADLFGQTDEDTLREVIRRNRVEIGRIESSKGLGRDAASDAATNFLLHGMAQSALQTEIQRAQFELRQREDLRTNFERGGEDSARRRFGGDEFAFNRLLQQALSRDTEQTETNRLLRELREVTLQGQRRIAESIHALPPRN